MRAHIKVVLEFGPGDRNVTSENVKKAIESELAMTLPLYFDCKVSPAVTIEHISTVV